MSTEYWLILGTHEQSVNHTSPKTSKAMPWTEKLAYWYTVQDAIWSISGLISYRMTGRWKLLSHVVIKQHAVNCYTCLMSRLSLGAYATCILNKVKTLIEDFASNYHPVDYGYIINRERDIFSSSTSSSHEHKVKDCVGAQWFADLHLVPQHQDQIFECSHLMYNTSHALVFLIALTYSFPVTGRIHFNKLSDNLTNYKSQAYALNQLAHPPNVIVRHHFVSYSLNRFNKAEPRKLNLDIQSVCTAKDVITDKCT